MTKWTIYGKDGKAKHESRTDYNSDGKVVYQDTFEYSGKWMGECFLTVSIKTAYPIDFQIGDYIDYRGEHFTINYDPTVIKKARRGTYGEGFTYDSIKFNSYSNELTQMRFHDWVLSDNKLHYTSLPTFSFYAKDVDDLVDRLQACADRWCKANNRDKSEYWMFYTLRNNTTGTSDSGQTQTTYDRTVQRANDVLESCGISLTSTEGKGFLSAVQTEWEDKYGSGDDYKDSRDDERYDRTISVSNQSIWSGMEAIKQQFGLNFIIRGRNVYVGTAGVPTEHLFEYGKGKGLYEVDRTADQDQLVVTRLHAYGSSDNLPTRYYAELNVQPFGVVEDIFYRGSHEVTEHNHQATAYYIEFRTDIKYKSGMFSTPTYYDRVGQQLSGIQGYVVRFHLEDSTTVLRGMVEAPDYMNTYTSDSDNKSYVQIQMVTSESNTSSVDWNNSDATAFAAFADALTKGKKVIFDSGIKSDAISSENKYYNTDNLPDNMAVNFLMLPGFPNNSLADLCKAEYDSAKDVTNYYIRKTKTSDYVLFHTESGKHVVTFSDDRHDPYILSPNASELGVLDGDISCTEKNDDNGLEKVYPTIEEMTVSEAGIGDGDTRIDAVVKADTVEDNGVYPNEKSDSVPGFNIYIPNLGFDLREAIEDAGGSEAKISMKDGFCGVRTFDIANATKQDDGTWKLNCKRTHDDDLDLWFPYSYAASVSGVDSTMTNAYQVLTGDHYVLTGIEVNDVNYVWAASVRLLKKAIHWLLKNDYTRYVYTPKIDEIYMARQDIEAKADATGATKSLHDTLKEGDMLLFSDDDLLINGAVYIDQLNIKENGNNGIPTYEVTLRNEIQVGTIERIQNQVDSLKTSIKGGTGSGLGATDVDPLVKTYGGKYFLSKLFDDTANGLLTLVKGFISKAIAVFVKGWKTLTYDGDDSLTGHGAMVDENGHGVFQSLTARGFFSAPKFVFNEIYVTKAEQWNTNAYGTIESVDTEKRQITLHLEDNEYGSVQVGDICRGIFADIGNEYGTDSNVEGDLDDCNFVIHKGFFTTYFAVEKIITNERGKCVFQYRKRTSATPAPCAYMDFAQYGSFTDPDRQSSMYMSSLGHSYYEVLEGVNNWEIQPQNRVARYGWLGDGESKGLTVIRKNDDGSTYTQVLKGNGLFAQNNVYFGDAVIELSNISNLEDLQKMAGSYDIALSQYQGVLTVDDKGNVIRGLYTLSAAGVKQWRLATTVYVRKGMDILLEEDAKNETVTEGHYRVTAFADGCECEIANSTIYITGIKNVRDGVTTTEDDINYDEMRKMTFCRVTIVVELEGKTSKTIEFPIRIVHDSLPFMVCDLSNEHDSVSYNTKTKQYTGFPVETVATLFYHNEPWQIDEGSHVDGLPDGLKATVEIKSDKKMYVSIEPDGTKEGDFLNTTGKDGIANVTHRINIHVSGTYAGAVYEYTPVLTLDRGCDVTVYDIVPSEDSIIRQKDGTMSASSLSVEIWATSTDDKRYQVTDLAAAGLTLLYGLGGKAATEKVNGNITIAGTETEIKLALVSSTDDSVSYDTETIPVVAWGEDGKGVEFIYWTGDKNPGYPVDDDTVNSDEYQKDEEYVSKIGNGWSDDPVDPTAESPVEYVSVRKSVNGVWGKFSYPAKFAMFSKAVASTNSLYGVFDNGTTPTADDEGFTSDTVTTEMLSSGNAGKYIWSVDEVTYNDGKKDRHNVSLVGAVDSMNEVQEMYAVTDSVEDEPTSDVKDWSFTDGRKAAASATKEGQALWNCDAVTYKDGNTICVNIQCIGTVGKDGRSITGSVTKYAACATDTHPGIETTDSDYTDWQDSVPSLDDDHPWLHIWTRYTYSKEPLTEDVFSKSKMGIDGNGVEYIYKRASDVQTILNAYTPTDWLSDEKYQTTDGTEYVPDGWTDNPSGVTKTEPYEYVSMRIRGKNGQWGAFSQPAPAYLYPRSIKTVDTYYAVATTGTTLTSDNFADYSPTTVLADTVIASNYNNNMSVWSADKTTYSYGGEADEVQYLNVTCLGTCDSLASVTEQYGISSDTSTYPSDSTVSSTPPTGLTAGQCVWSRDHIVWRSGTPASTDTAWQLIGMVGKQGEQGNTGNGISQIVVYYGLSSSGSTQPSSWSTSVQTPTDSQPWLWVRTRIYYTYSSGYDESYTKSYKGSDGDDGHSPYISNGYWYYYQNGSWVRGEKAQGDPGGTGAAGPIIRTHLSTDSDMTSGSFTFLPGDGYEYVDCIFYTPTKTWYQCTSYYTGSFSTSDTTHFKAMSSYTALATQLFLADNAKVNLLASQQINLMSGTSESTIWGSFRHVSDTSDYALWLGASTGASAPFSVKGNGQLYAKGGTFEEASVSGTFTTGSGDGKITISATNNIGTIDVGGWVDIGYNSTTQRAFGNLTTNNLSDYGGHIYVTSNSVNSYFGTSVNSYTTEITGLSVQTNFLFAKSLRAGSLVLGSGSSWASSTISSTLQGYINNNLVSILVMSNTSTVTVYLPPNPVAGQIFIVVQRGSTIKFSCTSKSIWSNGVKSSPDSSTTGQWNIFVYDGTYWTAGMSNQHL